MNSALLKGKRGGFLHTGVSYGKVLEDVMEERGWSI